MLPEEENVKIADSWARLIIVMTDSAAPCPRAAT